MLPASTTPPIHLALTLDRGLRLEIEPALLPLLAGWAPVGTSTPPLVALPGQGGGCSGPSLTPTGAVASARVCVTSHRCPRPIAPPEEPDVRVGSARGWVDDDTEVALLHGASGGWGRVDLAHARAEVVAPLFDETSVLARDEVAAELRAMCTIAVALLTGRREGVLVAAAAVIAPDGGGWLLVGDASSGKSTTAAHLVTAGWGYLADEEVLLHAGDRGGVWLEGWPRALPMESVWAHGRPGMTRPRAASGALPGDASGIARGRWRRTAPLTGILATRLAPDLPTALSPGTAPDALAGLVRATPWLLADHASTRYELGLLRSATRVPMWQLRLGHDTHGDVVRLAKCLRRLEAAS